jgi:hypothetical protein
MYYRITEIDSLIILLFNILIHWSYRKEELHDASFEL